MTAKTKASMEFGYLEVAFHARYVREDSARCQEILTISFSKSHAISNMIKGWQRGITKQAEAYTWYLRWRCVISDFWSSIIS